MKPIHSTNSFYSRNSFSRDTRRLSVALVVVFCAAVANAQQPDPVAATVGDQKIRVSQVEQEFKTKFGNREMNDLLAADLRWEILQRLAKQHLILAKFEGTDVVATDDEVNLEVERFAEQLKQVEKSLDGYLAEQHQTLDGFKFNLKWQRSWKKYLDQTLTDQVLEKYFGRNRRKLDGTRIKAAHVLLKLPDDSDESAVAAAMQKATSIREQVSSGSLGWDDATKQFSEAPSAGNSGDVGWIEYEGPMTRSFTNAAFALNVDEISPPTKSPFGIHLIRCLEIENGQVQWYDIRKQLRRSATGDLFELLSSRQRETTEVRFTDALPQPETSSTSLDQ